MCFLSMSRSHSTEYHPLGDHRADVVLHCSRLLQYILQWHLGDSFGREQLISEINFRTTTSRIDDPSRCTTATTSRRTRGPPAAQAQEAHQPRAAGAPRRRRRRFSARRALARNIASKALSTENDRRKTRRLPRVEGRGGDL